MTKPISDKTNSVEDSGTLGAVYYRPRSLLLVAHSLFIGLEDKTLNRKSFRLILSCSGDFKLTFENHGVLQTRAILLSPDIGAFEISAQDCNIALFDFAVASPEYLGLKKIVEERHMLPLEVEPFRDMQTLLQEGQNGSLSTIEVKALMSQAYQQVAGRAPEPLKYDPRITETINRIESLPFTDISLSNLARSAHLSPERLRKLFKQETGCTFSQYSRASALWRGMKLLDLDYTPTEIAHQIGFHDGAHFYHAFTDQFGVSLSDKLNQRKFHRVRCED